MTFHLVNLVTVARLGAILGLSQCAAGQPCFWYLVARQVTIKLKDFPNPAIYPLKDSIYKILCKIFF